MTESSNKSPNKIRLTGTQTKSTYCVTAKAAETPIAANKITITANPAVRRQAISASYQGMKTRRNRGGCSSRMSFLKKNSRMIVNPIGVNLQHDFTEKSRNENRKKINI